MIYDKSTAHQPDEEEDFQYQGKRRDQVEYSETVAIVLIVVLILLIAIVWTLHQL